MLWMLNPHRHDDITEVFAAWHGDQHAAIGITKRTFDIFRADVIQHVEQIGNVETDIERVTAVFNFHFLLCFFLFGIGAGDTQAAAGKQPAHAAKFFVGQNRRALQGLL